MSFEAGAAPPPTTDKPTIAGSGDRTGRSPRALRPRDPPRGKDKARLGGAEARPRPRQPTPDTPHPWPEPVQPLSHSAPHLPPTEPRPSPP